MHKIMSWRSAALLMICVTLTYQASGPWVIDDFEDNSPTIIFPGVNFDTTSATVGSIIGGERETSVVRTGGSGFVSLVTTSGRLDVSTSDAATIGVASVLWDGPGTSVLNMDYSSIADAFLIRVAQANAGTTLVFQLESGIAPFSLMTTVDITTEITTPTDVVVDLPGLLNFYTLIQSFELMLRPQEAIVEHICIIARLESVLTMSTLTPTVNDRVTVQLVVENPDSFPATAELVDRITIEVPSSHAMVDAGSLTTSAGTIVVNGNAVFVQNTGNLANNAMLVIEFDIIVIAAGQLSLQAQVFLGSGIIALSSDVPRSGIMRCCAANATVSQIQALPPTANPGSGSGDPHFVGFLDQHYDFHGYSGQIFNIISDQTFQLNAYFGNADKRLQKKKTYMTKLGVLMCGALIYFECDREHKKHIVKFNGNDMNPGSHMKVKHVANVKRMDMNNSKTTIKTSNYKVVVRFSESHHSSCHINFKLSYDHIPGSPYPHGVVGQTSQGTPKAKGTGMNSPNIVEGNVEDYIITDGDIFGTKFAFNRFDWQVCLKGADVYVHDTENAETFHSFGE